MAQYSAWEREYQRSTFLTKDSKPQADVLKALKFLKISERVEKYGLTVLDLGSGAGRNSNFLAKEGSVVSGIEISDTAIRIAQEYANEHNLSVNFIEGDIGSLYPFPASHFDLILDITSSNSLDESGRTIYIRESARVLKIGGHFIVKTLCKDGDANARQLLKMSPARERDTYIIPGLDIIERVFSKQDFEDLYKPFFAIQKLIKKTNYTRMNDRVYKRNFWIAYLKKERQ